MNIFAHVMLIGWIPVAVALMATQRQTHRGILLAFWAAWLFLPMGGYTFKGVPDYNKVTAMNLGMLIGVLLFDITRIPTFRPRWYDFPMAAWCLCPFFSSMANGLGPYDGLSAVLSQTVLWGIPYFLGRLCFNNLQTMRDLAVSTVLAAIVYVPLCLFEMKMSAQLHRHVYGFQHRANFEPVMSLRPFQWKPLVFMDTAFAVTLLMGTATLIAFWLWRTGALRTLVYAPIGVVFLVLGMATVLCKVWSGNMLTFAGLVLLVVTRALSVRFFAIACIAFPLFYMACRVSGTWSGEAAVALVEPISHRRAQSLQTRLDNEDQLTARALEQPLVGWGGWGRARIRDAYGRDVSLTDGFWIIALGQYGLVGLAAMVSAYLLPPLLTLMRWPMKAWGHPQFAAVAAMTVVLILHMIDNMVNANLNPLLGFAAGGLSGLIPAAQPMGGPVYTPPPSEAERRRAGMNAWNME